MICQGCEIWEENLQLRAEVERLREEKAQLEIENGKLKRSWRFIGTSNYWAKVFVSQKT
jgi:regulator of replication initiation timing